MTRYSPVLKALAMREAAEARENCGIIILDCGTIDRLAGGTVLYAGLTAAQARRLVLPPFAGCDPECHFRAECLNQRQVNRMVKRRARDAQIRK